MLLPLQLQLNLYNSTASLTATGGSLTLTGGEATLTATGLSQTLTATGGALTLSGGTATLPVTLTATGAALTLTGGDATLTDTQNRILEATGGALLLSGGTATLTDSGAEVTEVAPTGGWLNEYNAYRQRARDQERRRKEILDAVRELDGIDGEIAELMQLEEVKADEDKRIAEFRVLLDKEISKAELDKAGLLNKRINRAYDRAMKKATFSAMAALEREIEDAIEEEDFLFIIMSIQ